MRGKHWLVAEPRIVVRNRQLSLRCQRNMIFLTFFHVFAQFSIEDNAFSTKTTKGTSGNVPSTPLGHREDLRAKSRTVFEYRPRLRSGYGRSSRLRSKTTRLRSKSAQLRSKTVLGARAESLEDRSRSPSGVEGKVSLTSSFFLSITPVYFRINSFYGHSQKSSTQFSTVFLP